MLFIAFQIMEAAVECEILQIYRLGNLDRCTFGVVPSNRVGWHHAASSDVFLQVPQQWMLSTREHFKAQCWRVSDQIVVLDVKEMSSFSPTQKMIFFFYADEPQTAHFQIWILGILLNVQIYSILYKAWQLRVQIT